MESSLNSCDFRRDSTGIPSIVRKCVDEVERRGMNEVGIYRVSGVASEIQALKASFDAGANPFALSVEFKLVL